MTRAEVEKLIEDQYKKIKQNHSNYFNYIKDDELIKRHSLTIAFHESKFHDNAKNKNSTAKGLFQLLDGTRKDIEKRILKIKAEEYNKVWEPEYNTYLGVAYFISQYERYKGDMKKAIIAYNRGSWSEKATDGYFKQHKIYYKQLFPENYKKEYGKDEVTIQKKGFK